MSEVEEENMKKTCIGWTVMTIVILSSSTPLAIFARGERDRLEGKFAVPDSLHIQIIETYDGMTLIGRITEIEDDEIIFESRGSKTVIDPRMVKELREVEVSRIKHGQYWFPNPNETRMLFAPTARCLKAGEGYFADYYIFFPMLSYGITDNISIGGGMSIFPLGDFFFEYNLFYLTPKVGVQISNTFALGGGALLVKLPSFDSDEAKPTVGLLYTVTTIGDADNNLTLGAGMGMVDLEVSGDPMLLVGGQTRVTRKFALVSENWIIPGTDEPIVSYGMRFFGEKLSVDLGFINALGEDLLFPGIPYVDFVVKF
jgi:hypothetical protein